MGYRLVSHSLAPAATSSMMLGQQFVQPCDKPDREGIQQKEPPRTRWVEKDLCCTTLRMAQEESAHAEAAAAEMQVELQSQDWGFLTTSRKTGSFHP